jgi:hypothetical protein
VCAVTDNASNCQEAGLLLETEYPFRTWLGCLPHCLNLLLKDLAKITSVENPVKKASMVRSASSSLKVHTSGSSGAFAASNQAYNYFVKIVSTIRNYQRLRNLFSSISALELLSLPETRFAYSLIMLERLVVVKKALQQTVASQQWKRYKSKQCVPEILCGI